MARGGGLCGGLARGARPAARLARQARLAAPLHAVHALHAAPRHAAPLHPRGRLGLVRVRAAQGRAELEPAQVVLEELVVAGAQQLGPAATAARLAREGAKQREALRVRTSLRLRTPLRVGTSRPRR